MAKRAQTERLTAQHVENKGVIGIFGELARRHDISVGQISRKVLDTLRAQYPKLSFRRRSNITKMEINEKLKSIDPHLGQELYVKQAKIRPDGGIIEVKDDNDEWRIILVTEAKFQGKDVENIEKGILVGNNHDQDIMAAGNAIERSHKNIKEIANFMMGEQHFPYVLFLEGSNFLTETIVVTRPDGREVTLQYDASNLNRLDRLTAANYAMPINTNHCRNRVVTIRGQAIMLQAASIFTQGKGGEWTGEDMGTIMLDVAKTSLRMLATDLFSQLSPESAKRDEN
ncbi:hypothetical protein MHJ95_09895 [Corynebacterium imitans]|uniref:EcoRI family type II restriction endonuclease n=1 Tax=Corynebacterium imitans TaxID=156978 RepID=UPI001EF1B186|nr:EcoRI family type II restriction endonuclease [Corynebacterium imitans]MCG7279289.1 hypothetical protein [Corynebacterium imitans]